MALVERKPNLVLAYDKYKNKDFEVIGISLDEDEEDWRGAVDHLKISWPQLSDLKGGNARLPNCMRYRVFLILC